MISLHPLPVRLMTAVLFVLATGWSAVAQNPSPDAPTPPPPPAEETPAPTDAARTFKLPGLAADLDRGYVDLDATVCLDEGYLELVACTKDTKEHESLVAVDASPRHIHAALLLIGAVNGHPAMRQQVGEGAEARWVRLPPRGEQLAVSLVISDGRGSENAFPISAFIRHHDEEEHAAPREQDFEEAGDDPTRFPDRFLFAGSHLIEAEEGQPQYVADRSGHVITIASFGDGVLCLPGQHSADNAELVWRVNPEMLPEVGTKVKLRLERIKPVEKDEAEADERGEG